MNKFNIIDLSLGKRFLKIGYSPMYLNQSDIILSENWDAILTENENEALVMDYSHAQNVLNELDQFAPNRFTMMEANTKDHVASDLNSFTDLKMKLITEIVQEIDPVKFSQSCEDLCSSVNPDTLHSYVTHSTIALLPGGQQTIVFIAIMQYWGMQDQYNEWIEKLRVKNLIIKP